MAPGETPRVLSLQSHVVHGYVGNKCAVFPLQLLGFDVDPLNSVQFSNHTGYPVFKGSRTDGAGLRELTEGLRSNGLLRHTHLLTGYIGSASMAEEIASLAASLREATPGLQYVCDPVLGDNGRLYVPQECVEVYKSALVPAASVVTPNAFEAECITGLKVTNEQEALKACDALHQMGPHTVVITSLNSLDNPEEIVLVASTTEPQPTGAPAKLKMTVKSMNAYFTGTGDLLAALLLAWTHRCDSLVEACERSIATVQAVLMDTAATAGDAAFAKERTKEVCQLRELRIVQNQAAIKDPEISVRASALT